MLQQVRTGRGAQPVCHPSILAQAVVRARDGPPGPRAAAGNRQLAATVRVTTPRPAAPSRPAATSGSAARSRPAGRRSPPPRRGPRRHRPVAPGSAGPGRLRHCQRCSTGYLDSAARSRYMPIAQPRRACRPDYRLSARLQVLSEDGTLDPIRDASGETLYRKCRSDAHHHHLTCRNCGKSVEVEGRAVERLGGTCRGQGRLHRRGSHGRTVRLVP